MLTLIITFEQRFQTCWYVGYYSSRRGNEMVDGTGERVDDTGTSGQHGWSVGLSRSVGNSTDTKRTRRLGGTMEEAPRV